MSILKLKQHKVILRVKEMNKKFETNRLMTKDNLRGMTYWDIILCNSKKINLKILLNMEILK